MGSDFQTRQFFCGSRDPAKCRRSIMERVRQYLLQSGYEEVETEAEGDRSLVFGPPGRWLHIGDTTGTAGLEDPIAFDALSRELSHDAATVDVAMYDGISLHLRLFHKGQLVDVFTNDAPTYPYVARQYARRVLGKPLRWRGLLQPPARIRNLRTIWVQEKAGFASDIILRQTARLLGWHPDLAFVGYTHDLEGVNIKYDVYLQRIGAEITGFEEVHFRIRASFFSHVESLNARESTEA